MEFSPETYKLIQTLFGSIGVVISLLFGFFLLLVFSKKDKAYIFLAIYFILFAIRIGKSLFYGYYTIESYYLVFFLGLLLAIGPSLWLFSKNLISYDYRSKKPYYLFHFLPFLLVLFFSKNIPVHNDSNSWFFHIGLFTHGMAYSFMTLYEAYKIHHNQLSCTDVKHKKWLIILSVVTIVMFMHYLLIYFSIIPYYPSGVFLFSAVIILISIWMIKRPSLFKVTSKRYLNSKLSQEEIKKHNNRLTRLLDLEKLYLNPELSLSGLGDSVGIEPKLLSQVINQVHNKNYSQFIASYRIEEAKKMLRAKKYKDYKISSIAYESGFNNLSSFNVYFKKFTNTTAIQYRDSISVL